MVVHEIFGEFEPVVQTRDYLRLTPESTYGFYKVKGFEPIGRFTKNFAKTITSGSSSKNNEWTDVYMEDNYLGQFMVYIYDDFEMDLNLIGRTQLRGTTKYVISSQHSFSKETNMFPGLSQFFTFEDEYIYVDLYNPTAGTITSQRVIVYGYKYWLEKIDSKPDKYTDIPIGKLGTGV
jgi:hypothetical protein